MQSCWRDSGWWLDCRRLLAVPARYQQPRLCTIQIDSPGIGQQSEDRSGAPRPVGNGDDLAEAEARPGGEVYSTRAQQKREVVRNDQGDGHKKTRVNAPVTHHPIWEHPPGQAGLGSSSAAERSRGEENNALRMAPTRQLVS